MVLVVGVAGELAGADGVGAALGVAHLLDGVARLQASRSLIHCFS